MYDETIPVLTRILKAQSAILDKAEAHCTERKIEPSALLNFRLYPDMWPLSRQVSATADHARRSVARLAGKEPENVADSEPTFDGLRARIAQALKAVEKADRAAIDAAAGRTITFPVGPRTMELSGADYVRGFVLPNFYFHATTAYDILRHNGVPLTKTDFLGG